MFQASVCSIGVDLHINEPVGVENASFELL